MSNREILKQPLTIVFAFRDRDLQRVERCLGSLAAQTRKDFSVNFVDYGSRPSLARSTRALVESFPFCRYIYTDTRGWRFNKSRALNIGIRMAKTEYILNTDADIIFAPNFVDTVLGVQDANSTVSCAPHWLPKSFTDWDQIENYKGVFPKKRSALGTCQCYPLSVIQELQGFDEQLYLIEDKDLQIRLKTKGLRERWVKDQTATFHQWHPPGLEHNRYYRQERWVKPHYERIGTKLVRNDLNWGTITCHEQRFLFHKFPLAETEELVDWPTLLSQLGLSTSTKDLGLKWLITDRSKGPGYTSAVQAGYETEEITAPWTTYLFNSAEEIEHRLESLLISSLAKLGDYRASSPNVIVLDISTYLRISRKIFIKFLETLAPGGILVISNLEGSNLARAPRQVGWIMTSYLRKMSWYLRYPLSTEARLRSYEMTNFFDNNLQDSLHLAHVGVPSILDMRLDFPTAGATAIFLKA